MKEIKNFDFFGLKISDFSLNQLKFYLAETIKTNKQIVGYGYSLGIIAFFKKYPSFYTYCNSFDLMVTDGTILYWLMKLFGYKLNTFLSIPQLSDFVLKLANDEHYSVLLIGSTDEINSLANQKLKEKYKDIQFLQGYHGYFTGGEEDFVVEHINKFKPDILLIGMPTPAKEEFVYKNRHRIFANIIIPNGGMINVYAGLSEQPPSLIKKMGGAAFYRLIKDPKKLFLRYLWIASEIFLKILPTMFFEIIVKRNKNFTIPMIYKIDVLKH